jgi:hypothetical protein
VCGEQGDFGSVFFQQSFGGPAFIHV